MRWWRYRRVAARGRFEVECRGCLRLFWLSFREVRWSLCPHCAGWWVWPTGITASHAYGRRS